jgi:uncharacterized protein
MTTEAVREILMSARTVAVLGAHIQPVRPAYYVPAYLAEHGYQIWPVNPRFAGQELFGRTTVARLAELVPPIDMVDIFRPAHALPAHVPDILAMNPLPTTVWFQLGIRNDGVARELRQAGIQVVQDRCTLADHRALGLG